MNGTNRLVEDLVEWLCVSQTEVKKEDKTWGRRL